MRMKSDEISTQQSLQDSLLISVRHDPKNLVSRERYVQKESH